MKQIILTFIEDDRSVMPEVLLPKELRAEAEVLFKLNELFIDFGNENLIMKDLADDCSERLNELQAEGVRIAKSRGKEVDEEGQVSVLKEPVQWR